MKALLIGLDGLSYTSFMKCNPRFLMSLFGSTFRGVVVNRRPQTHESSWLSVLGMDYSGKPNEGVPELAKATGATLVNVPISDPTTGIVSLKIHEVRLEDELNQVTEAVLESLNRGPVIAGIVGLDVELHRGSLDKCKAYSMVDSALRKMVNAADEFIVFSPFGEPKAPSESEHEEYGIYLSTVPRPSEHETVKLPEIGLLFRKLVG